MQTQLEQTAREILLRHPAPAVQVEELQTLVARERPGPEPSLDHLIATLRPSETGIRVVDTDPPRLSWHAPTGWAVAPADEENHGTSLARVMRESLRRLGECLEPGSNLALARWARLLNEERRARHLLEKR